jgi:hypothetical protein
MSALFPRTFAPRQGQRKRDRWGPCKACGYPAGYVCAKCSSWRCASCVRFRAAPGRSGLYFAHCLPRCQARMNPDVAERVRALTRARRATR